MKIFNVVNDEGFSVKAFLSPTRAGAYAEQHNGYTIDEISVDEEKDPADEIGPPVLVELTMTIEAAFSISDFQLGKCFDVAAERFARVEKLVGEWPFPKTIKLLGWQALDDKGKKVESSVD